MDTQHILIVDDEPNIVQLVSMYLTRENYQVNSAGNGQKALEMIDTHKPDLVVLDVMLPSMDGFDVCRRLRAEENNVPIIMVTARDDDIDKILGLELGADDYLTKPFNPRELVARIRAVLRREVSDRIDAQKPVRVADLEIDLAGRVVKINEKPIALRTQEFEVLRVLIENKGIVMTRAAFAKSLGV